jgi:hydrogenase maturation protein HypF
MSIKTPAIRETTGKLMKSNVPRTIVGATEFTRLKTVIRGAVQGVGFRPFVFKLATQMNLSGWVSNTSQGVYIEVEGNKETLDRFLLLLQQEKPPISFIQSMESSFLDPMGFSDFEIRESDESGLKTTLVLPDIATCPDCLGEIFDPGNRRHLYPFTNCTNCGPRFTIIQSLPYDRANTSMRLFTMCPECRREYEDPRDRRFHAQPNACPVCGPRVELWDARGKRCADNLYAMLETANAIRNGKIIAVKGLGGFHLFVDASNDDAIARLRERKQREEKPFALMYPSLQMIREDCVVSELEERLLLATESPIVLLRRMDGGRTPGLDITLSRLSSDVAPSNPYLGVMMPYTPLHHILMRELRIPVVATSGNLSDEPICTDESEALQRLRGIADLFLVHNRPIVRHVDDSIVRIVAGRELVLRRSRGYAPLPIRIESESTITSIAVGAHLKNTVALSHDSNVFISQHIGDLETSESFDAFQRSIKDMKELYGVGPSSMVCDMHPDYLSSKYARSCTDQVTEVQHHYAHIASCMAENQIEGPVLGVSWDGTGYGLDETIWGGEFLVTDDTSFVRKASFAQFKLPGGDKAVKEPRRSAIGVLYEILESILFSLDDIAALKSFKRSELDVLHQMLVKNLNSPRTSSVGRLFDAVASIVGIRQVARYEGQAAMELEFLTLGTHSNDSYPYEFTTSSEQNDLSIIDWRSMILGIVDDVRKSVDVSLISTKFHNSLVSIVVDAAKRVGLEKVVLSGGCFQNVYLTEHCIDGLRKEGFRPYWHQRVPPNDGGIALGQIYAMVRLNSKKNQEMRTNRTKDRFEAKEN